MTKSKVVITDGSDTVSEAARAILTDAGLEVVDVERQKIADPLAAMRDADALMVIWYAVTEEVLRQLRPCRIIVRCGIGVDNIDLEGAARHGIPVCNVPDYCIGEVADHAFSLALTLLRQLPFLERALRESVWKPTLPYPMPALASLTFGTLGFGRTGSAFLERARPFGCRRIACDPYVPDAKFAAAGVTRVTREQLYEEADVLSLHSLLNAETRHILDDAGLARMKPTAILVNTARGALVETEALVDALQTGKLAAAGIDVFDTEPLPLDHPLLRCPNVMLTPHFAWHSRQSKALLPVMAAEEIVRGLRGEPLRGCMNLGPGATARSL